MLQSCCIKLCVINAYTDSQIPLSFKHCVLAVLWLIYLVSEIVLLGIIYPYIALVNRLWNSITYTACTWHRSSFFQTFLVPTYFLKGKGPSSLEMSGSLHQRFLPVHVNALKSSIGLDYIHPVGCIAAILCIGRKPYSPSTYVDMPRVYGEVRNVQCLDFITASVLVS